MDRKILPVINGSNFNEWLNEHEILDETNKLRIKIWLGFTDTIEITDLKDAMKIGKTCIRYTVKLDYKSDREGYNIYNNFLKEFDHNIKRTFDYLESLEFETTSIGKSYEYFKERNETIKDSSFTVYKSKRQAIRTFSPFNLAEIKPLKEEPKKWTITHCIRALINGQFEPHTLKCDGHYTDDYAWDNAVNFGRGEILNAKSFAEGILQSPAGWWCFKTERGEISLNCHSFDNNSFKPLIKEINKAA